MLRRLNAVGRIRGAQIPTNLAVTVGRHAGTPEQNRHALRVGLPNSVAHRVKRGNIRGGDCDTRGDVKEGRPKFKDGGFVHFARRLVDPTPQ